MAQQAPDLALNLTTKISLVTYGTLWILGFLAIGLLEWGNSFQDLSVSEGVNAALLQSTTARSSGSATVPIESMHESTWFVLDALMFVGGGSASAAGGIKITTLAVLVLAHRGRGPGRWPGCRGLRQAPPTGRPPPRDRGHLLGSQLGWLWYPGLLQITALP